MKKKKSKKNRSSKKIPIEINYWSPDSIASAYLKIFAKGDELSEKTLKILSKRLKKSRGGYHEGGIMGYPGSLLPTFVVLSRLYADLFNGNNIMLHYGKENKGNGLERSTFEAFHEMEIEFMEWLANLYHSDANSTFGYITPGGTESNLYAFITAYKYFKKKFSKEKIQVVMAGQGHSHYSFWKPMSLFNIDYDVIEIHYNSDGSWSLPDAEIENRPTIVVLNAPSINTGIIDTPEIIDRVRTNVDDNKIWGHIDAAFGGLVVPFIAPKLVSEGLSFRNRFIKSITIDPHKTGFVAYNTGAIIIKCPEAQELLTTNVQYLSDAQDITICGSRSASSVCSAWVVKNILGEKGLKQIWDKQFEQTRKLIGFFRKSPHFRVIGDPVTPVFALRLINSNLKLQWEALVKFYTIVRVDPIKINSQNITIYRFSIMPHVCQHSVEKLIADVQQLSQISTTVHQN